MEVRILHPEFFGIIYIGGMIMINSDVKYEFLINGEVQPLKLNFIDIEERWNSLEKELPPGSKLQIRRLLTIIRTKIL